ncbi:molybdenum cofactor guanylyltransferase [Evansella cellulosilytica]|uniref:Probable molybdenum cofactor guanylyltransferase n=1 Tax=Evansella cellulosilytica (strain ATCC 21833 / DSM 2522 / FERM P-1141 / JCM 9156 / N-4) TaxID=649639 RepID=E6U1S5_EVAC2|nr:molybdenum cofactor guanylyltransferase [Evansella cellulosilytica]ADU31572.1 formate dehydrogenase family accessory protein FdhD [Evansella cellulosilytica DSM 2522]
MIDNHDATKRNLLPLTGVILAGGRSRRMGKDKALLKVSGKTTIERITNIVTKTCQKTLIISNDIDKYQFLNKKIVKDMYVGKGPLAGIHAGLRAANTEWCFFIANDMPLITRSIVFDLYEISKEYSQCDAIVPRVKGRIHPLCAFYKTSALRKVESCLEKEELKMSNFLSKINVHEVVEKPLYEKGYSEEELDRIFFNMNEPCDYRKVLEVFK